MMRDRASPKVLAAASLFFVLISASATQGQPEAETPAPSVVDFTRDVEPILAARCHRCHGPKQQKSGLRLDRERDALAGGDSGPALVPGKGATSLLILYVTGRNEDDIVMPPQGELLTPSEIDILRAWIDQGARFGERGESVTEPSSEEAEARRIERHDHWSFRPVVRPPVPRVQRGEWARNPIDAFVLARLEGSGVVPSPEADRRALIRRLHLDLIGLPPSPEDVELFVRDDREDACERLVDRLLASPHFGERWGRHWLDLARYADSNGYEDDKYRPDAWRYRDWVVGAVNSDLPFDRFTIEQLAGDLLEDGAYEQKVATGFHRMLPSNEVGVKASAEEFRVITAKDRADTTAMVWLGLTLGCAKCHSHKYDPVSQREYYGFYAFFNSVVDVEIDAPPLPEKYQRAYEKAKAAYEKAHPENDNNAPLAPSTRALTLAESSESRATFIHLQGSFLRTGSEVEPQVPAFLPPIAPRGPQADRLDLARWIVDPANPLTRRVEANRIWQHLFGHGLVRSPEDFGIKGEPPSHVELLDWLAAELMSCGWRRKPVIRMIVTSSTYRQASRPRADLLELDPENRLLARQNRFPVDAEIVRDLALSASGLLVRELGGPGIQPPLPAALADMKELRNERFMEVTEGADRYRRGLYVNVQRTFTYPAIETFDGADPNVACARRDRSSTPLQALTLLNEPAFFECARALGLDVAARPGTRADRIRHVFVRCLARGPDDEELSTLEELQGRHARFYDAHPDTVEALLTGAPGVAESSRAEAAAWVGVARTVMNLEEFITRE